jgi:hypothetical protein
LPGACPALVRRLPGACSALDGKNDIISKKEVIEALGIWATNGVKVNTKLLHY